MADKGFCPLDWWNIQSTFAYNLRFPGQYYDPETGLNQNWNRDYDPIVGRYIESDPIGLHGGINTYSYTGSAPVQRTDVAGLDYWLEGALPSEGGLGFHQKICVGKPEGSRFCISYGEPEDQDGCLFHCKGHVYNNSLPVPLGRGPVIPGYYRITDSATDDKVAAIFWLLLSYGDNKYSVIGNSCRNFSQDLFSALVATYGGEIPIPSNPRAGMR